MSKLSPHMQIVPSWAPGLFDGRVLYEKHLFYGGDYEDRFPRCHTIARHWIGGDGVEAEYIQRGHQGGLDYFERLLPVYQALRGKVLAHEGCNEPGVSSSEARRNLSEFYRGWLYKMRAFRFRTVSGCFANGTPDVTQPQTVRELGWAFCGTYLGLHEYGPGAMQSESEWYALRHRKLVSVRKQIGLSTSPILITETGIDLTEQGRGGWRDVMNWEMYRDQLLWFDAELTKDKNVLAAFLFTSAPWGDKWQSFDVNKAQWKELLEV